MRPIQNYIAQIFRRRENMRRQKLTRSVLAVLVVIAVAWQLRLPGITLTDENQCGLEEHAHSALCAASANQTGLGCTEESVGVHSHDASCRNGRNDLICGKADFMVHEHTSACYGEASSLLCKLPEVKLHTHDGSCYQSGPAHTHIDSCYEWVTPETTSCTIPETTGHTHESSCYQQYSMPVCDSGSAGSHHHTPSCWQMSHTPTCGNTSGGHRHTHSCYVSLNCGADDSRKHEHTEECYRKLTCSLGESEGHVHNETCTPKVKGELTCTLSTESGRTCTKEEIALHTHTEGCYYEVALENGETQKILACPELEVLEHKHSTSCYGSLSDSECTLPEHTHDPEFCPLGVVLTEEEKEQVREVKAAIDELPGAAEITANLAFTKLTDPDSYDTVRQEYVDQVQKVKDAFDLLTEDQQKAVTNSEDLSDYDFLFEDEEEDPNANFTGTPYSAALEDGSIQAEVLTKGSLPEGASFELSVLSSQSAAYEQAQAAVEAWAAEMEMPLLDSVSLDMHFVDENGAEIQPNGKTQVTLTFAEPILKGEGSIFALHITPNGAENVTHGMERTDAGVSAITLQTDDFSNIILARVVSNQKLTVTAMNSFTWEWTKPTVLYRNTNRTTVGENFTYWVAVVVENDGTGQYVVTEVNRQEVSKLSMRTPADGFIIFYHKDHVGEKNIRVGDTAVMSNDSWKTNNAKTHNASGYLEIAFVREKAAKTNSLTTLTAASTKDFITLNLYDYGSGSTGKNINDKFNSNAKYPGFQQSGGTTAINKITATGSMNFGDIITDDPNTVDGKIVTDNASGINRVRNSANSPISFVANENGNALAATNDVMHETLINGYPALADGTSLAYLFGGTSEGYSKKINTANIDGLFQRNASSGMYTFNSRETNAQFDPDTNRFVLTKQILTPNFIMYPFGNFMPFNDIVHDAKQVYGFNRDYFQEMAVQANFLYASSKSSEARYNQLHSVLNSYIALADTAWGTNWTAKKALLNYFANGSQLPDDGNGFFTDDFLKNIYSLDYDVEKDFYFGMDMSMNLLQPKDGRVQSVDDGEILPMYFYFTGDDDVWVYIDERLTLDLSGIHRHVGGAIDFEMGTVLYFALDTKNGGDVGSTVEQAYHTVHFEDIFPAEDLIDTGITRKDGTNTTGHRFKDYSLHTFKFYYMERGSGSSVCRLNFNFPRIQSNSISVSKLLTDSESAKADTAMGNPDYRFRIIKENSEELYIGANVEYEIHNAYGALVGTGTTDANGIFTLKAGQTAVFGNIKENAGKYRVQELLTDAEFEQFGYKITVAGSTETKFNKVTVDTDTFHGVTSSVQDPYNGSTLFNFENQFQHAAGTLEVAKEVNSFQPVAGDKTFEFLLNWDGVPAKTGASYQVWSIDQNTLLRTDTITEGGKFKLAAGEKAVFQNVMLGSKFTVEETAQSALGYTVAYQVDNGAATDTPAAGAITVDNQTVRVQVTNDEKGAGVHLPVQKTMPGLPDGESHTFRFTMTQVTDHTGATAVEGGRTDALELTYPMAQDAQTPQFTIAYPAVEFPEGTVFPVERYYRITEEADASKADTIAYDDSIYVAKVSISKAADGEMEAQIVNWYQDGAVKTGATAAEFENLRLTTLTLGKNMPNAVSDLSFSFTINLTRGGMPVTGTFPAVRTEVTAVTEETVVFDETGTATVSLAPTQRLELRRIPVGADWTITEQNGEQFSVSYRIDEGEEVYQTAASGTSLPVAGTTVIFINRYGYLLPTTGGAGTIPYIFGGLLLMAAPLKYNRSQKKRGRRCQCEPQPRDE